MSNFQVILLSNVTPRYVCWSSYLSVALPRASFPGLGFVDSEKRVAVDFSLLIVTHQLSAHAAIFSRANCILYVAVVAYSSLHQSTRSSAKSAAWTPFGNSATMSLIKSMNREGERTPPWGTPCFNSTFRQQ